MLSLGDAERTAVVAALSPRERRTLAREAWPVVARPEQLEPAGDWFLWLMRPGRGWGKTYAGIQAIRRRLDSGRARTAHVVSRTVHHCADVLIHGTPDAPGLLSLWPVDRKPELQVQKRRLVTHNGAIIRWFGADEPADFQGPQADVGYIDEVDRWKPKGMSLVDAFDDFERGIRLGPDPRIFVSSTPRPGRLIAHLLKRDDIYETRGGMKDNAANLNPVYVASQLKRFEGTRRGRQELDGELLEDVEGAIVNLGMIDAHRVLPHDSPDIVRVVVGVDPSGTTHGDAQGIVVKAKGIDGHGYTLADRTCNLTPEGWGRRAVETAHEFDADCIVVETNYGGDMCEAVIRAIDPSIRIKKVHATRGKHVRFEPLGARYERGEEHHVGTFPELEDEVCAFTPNGYDGDASPNRADAAVWADAELFPVRRGLSPADLYGEPEEAGAAA